MSSVLRKCIICITALYCFTNAPLTASTIHALIAADTLTKVKYSSREDIKCMCNALGKIAQETGMQLNLTIASGKKLSKNHITRWVQNVDPEPDDVVFFYFTGHGFRIANSKSKWPELFFVSSKNAKKMTFYIDKLKKKNARLNIVLCDCCNNSLSQDDVQIAKGIGKERRRVPKNYLHPDKYGYKKLFLETSGFIIASGSVPGRSAWTTKSGGLFTRAFLRSLQKETTEQYPNWSHVFKQTSVLCNIMQEPQYQLFIGKE